MFSRVLVANRGEIAVRVLRSLRELGIGTVAAHSEPETDALHVRCADQAVCLGPGPVAQSYLRIEAVIEAALATGAQAIHPGYGLLAENPEFAAACRRAGITFIGPDERAIRTMGSKIAARRLMTSAGVPVVPGSLDPVEDLHDALELAADIGYPIAVKASGAGGGKGFRVAQGPDSLPDALDAARGEGERFFGDATVYLERYLSDPRHVEVQILADAHGNVVHLYERDCSIQRRHQKLVEEAPAPRISRQLRSRIGQIAVEAARAVDYTSAGTVEGLVDGDDFYFLEMNTRIQVEHSVTEMITGVDLVAEQVRIAAGEPLGVTQEGLRVEGHAIECRINAEDAARNFLPRPGLIQTYREPAGPGVRVDSGVEPGSQVLAHYDPLLAKLVVWGADRDQATASMLRALSEYEITGVTTLIPFHRALLSTPQWAAGETCRDLLMDRAWLRGTADA